MRLVLLLAATTAVADDEIVSIVTTKEGVQRSITAKEVDAYAIYNAAVASQVRGEYARAVAEFEEALAIAPALPEALINLGNAYSDLANDGVSDVAKAAACYERAIAAADHPKIVAQAESNLGHLLSRNAARDVAKLEVARGHLERAIAADPDFPDAHFNYGIVLDGLGRVEDARAAYERTMALAPAHENARLNLANTYFTEGDSDAAARIQLELVADPTLSRGVRLNALNNLGQTFRDGNLHDRAEAVFGEAVAFAPDDGTSLGNLMTARRTICKWAGFEETQRGLLAIVEASLADFEGRRRRGAGVGRRDVDLAVMPYDATLLQHFPNDVLRRLTSAQVFQRFGHAAPPPPRRARRSRLRVGYLSFDFREHPMGYLTRRLVSDHDPAVVETFVLSYGENDASVLRTRAERRPEGGFLELFDVDVAAAKRGMDALDLDVVVDLMTHTRGARLELASESVAPPGALLISYLGYPGVAGGGHFDYTMADAKVLPPDHAAATAAEPLIYLPFSYQANDYGAHWPPADLGARRAPGPPRYCNFNQIDKYEPESFTLWMGALRRSPGATLALLRPKEPLGAVVVANLAAEAAARGVHPARLVWLGRVPRQAHLTRMAETCDLFLDNLVYGAHTTGADSLWAAVPLLAIRGFGGGGGDGVGRFASRVGASLLAAAALENLTLVDSVKDFEAVAGALPFERLRNATVARTSAEPLFDAARSVASAEAAYEAAYEAFRAGKRTWHVVVDPAAPRDRAGLKDCRYRRAPLTSDLGGARSRPASAATTRTPTSGRRLRSRPAGDAAARPRRTWPGSGRDDGGVAGNLNEALRAAAPDDARLLGALFASSALSPSDAGLRLGVARRSTTLALAPRRSRSGSRPCGSGTRAQRADERGRTRLDARDAALAKRGAARRAGNLVVAIYCDEYGQTWWPDWGPSSLETGGLGGSEEAVVFVARELAKRGHAVEVYNECADHDLGDDAHGVAWLRHATYDASRPPDVFVAWRYHVSTAVADPATHGKVYAWLQDARGGAGQARDIPKGSSLGRVPGYGSWTAPFVDGLAGIFTLSKFHTATLPPAARPKAYETPNGIDPSFLVDGDNAATVFAYGSAPNRGLYEVLKGWPAVRGRVPNATLVVYYGFSPAFVTWGARHIPAFDAWRAEVERLLRQPGVDYRGMVGHDELARGYARAGFVLYPTTYPETGCVSLMKAMALGAIPITSRFAGSVVPELTVRFDLGPATPRRADAEASILLDDLKPAVDAADVAWQADFAAAAADAAERAARGELDGHRAAMKRYARDRFLWKHVAEKWEAHFLGRAT
ncbi:protein N-acetylglucosaminyltransferase [Aureococcus anophagefferens]|uniref:protein O-GlcNAc transferase n=1 Tax=Aureococcus anophagefferens TaxID=44056 RepID=A0ABR1G186_AURAN